MAKIQVSSVIERLKRSLIESPDSTCDEKTGRIINDMRIIQDFMGKQKLGKRSRLDYFLSDIVDMVHEALNVKDDLTIYAKLSSLERWVGEVEMRLLKFGLNGAEMRSVGVEGDDDDESSVVGLEQDVKLLLSTMIFNEEQGLQTSTIKGMTGIGKTTLARQVYNHVDVKDRFEYTAWVLVSSELSHKEVLVKLIQQVAYYKEVERDSILRKMEYADNRTLRRMLHQHLQGTRYFIVLDDWQEEMCLRSILKGLPHEDKGSRLLLTNRTYSIEESTYYNYETSALDSVYSWQLFLKTIFSCNEFTSDHKFPEHLEKKGREMLTKCMGLPLAIKEVSTQLAKKRELGTEWEDLLDELWQCRSNQDKVTTNKKKALTSWVIQKFERSMVEIPDSCNEIKQEVINELRIILDFLGETKLGNWSRLNYFISDIADMVRETPYDDDLSIHDKIFYLKRWVVDVKNRMFKLGVDEAEMRSENVGVEGGDYDEDVVGLEKDVELLLRRAIFNEERCLQTSSITGMDGSGKTTLARQVYNHATVVHQFDRRAWVCVPSELSYKQLLIKLIQQVIDFEEVEKDLLLNKIEYADNRSLTQMLRHHLQGMRYFIVLDDWPEEMCLRSIMKGLPDEDKGSRLLLTNRTYCIEEHIYYDYVMTSLDSVSSWELFLKTIFSDNKFTSEHNLPKHLEIKGREILRKCCGVPLAIKDVGSQLAEKRRRGSEWEDLLELSQCMSNQGMVATNMAKALILWMIRKLERSRDEISTSWNGKREEVINEQRIILDFLGDKKLGDWSRLNYFISDIGDIVHDDLGIYDKLFSLKRWVVQIEKYMLKLRVDEGFDNVGVEEGDDDEEVVGLEKDVELLLRRAIYNEEQGLQTSTITGIVGIGKTTLARQVYNHADVVGRFERRAWVCVSTDLSYKEVLMKLIQQVVDYEELQTYLSLNKLEYEDNQSLKQMLHRQLQGMQYIIVFDNWPEEMRLRYILQCLPDEEKGSRLLLTSRTYCIEEITYYNYEMIPLDTVSSWQLFMKTIVNDNKFTSEHKFSKHLEEKGREMLTQCCGLPLAIKDVARQLATKRRSGSEWEDILELRLFMSNQDMVATNMAKALTLWVIGKLDRSKASEWEDLLELWQCKSNEDMVTTNMAKALTLWRIRKLERSMGEIPDSWNGKLEEVINELRVILDFFGETNLGNGSRLCYFINDIVEVVCEAIDIKDDDLSIYDKIFSLKRSVVEAKMRMFKMGVDEADMISENVGVQGDYDEDVVGLEKDTELLLSRVVFNEEQGLQTSTITGMVGIGKTTLARQVYNHADVVGQFERRAWLCVSDLSYKEVLMKLIQQVVDYEELQTNLSLNKMEYEDNRILKQMLHQQLQGKQYFIVLDDCQDEMCLRYILKCLPDEDKGSRLLLTSRTFSIEKNIYFDYEMTSLDSDSSWQLFFNTIFSENKFTGEQNFPNHLEKKGREMLKKCCGLPLAIKDVGMQLAKKRRLTSEWEDLLELWQCIPDQDMVATDMARALTSSVIRKLKRSIVEIPDSCNEIIEKVINELRLIMDFLREKKLGNGRSLNYLISDIVDMVRETLDARVDDLSIRRKISSLERWVVEVKKHTLRLGACEVEMRSEHVGVEGGLDDEYVVGLEKDVELLLHRAIFDDEQGLKTSTITGMVGIGKTTLARQIFNHADVVCRFECRVWVCVSTDISYKEVLMKVIQQVVDYEELQTDLLLNKMEYEDNQSLKQMLRQHLQGKQYFIVLDDWPEEMCLEYILTCLPNEDKGSRLQITKRTYSEEENTNYDYEMTPLDSVSSWQLFEKTLFSGYKFRSARKIPMQLQKKGKEMLTKCCGVPLTIKDVGRQLGEKIRSGSEWKEFHKLWQHMSNQDMAKALTLWVMQKRERSKVSQWKDLLRYWSSVESYRDEIITNMAKALTVWMIRKLERSIGEIPEYWNGKQEEVINELRLILDFLRGKKFEIYISLNYFISDIVDIVREAMDFKDDDLSIYDKMLSLKRCVVDIKTRTLKLGVDEAEMRSENDGVEGGDDDEDVVGLEKDVQLLLRRAVFNKEQGLQTSTITGMIGIGKTTLARQVYNHASVVGQFERRVWVCVSTNLSYKEVVVKLIQQVVDCEELQTYSLLNKVECEDKQSFTQMLHHHLQGIQYLIVLDDWPEEMCLKYILKCLPDEGKGSRLLLTGRSHYIEENIHYNHEMKYLDFMKSWQLFSKTIFGGNKLKDEDKFPKHFESRGKELLRECGGLPLAIKHVGRQLAKKRQSGSEWEEILESIDFDAIFELLEPFYQKLDPIVKSSFLHLAFFKENTVVRTEKLMILISAAEWIASEEEMGIEMASEEEIRKSLYQMIKEYIIEVEDYPIKRFRINALLHKLSTKKAEKEIGFEMVRNNGNTRSSQSPRHRAIYCSRDKFNYSTDEDKHIVSLFFRGGGHLDASPSYWKSFEQLKILDLEDFGIKILPESICTLTELRYLGLRNNYIQELPCTFLWLGKLQVLDIALNCMVEVPEIIWRMSSLRHLYMSNVVCRKPLELYTLKLETLSYISVDNRTYKYWATPKMMTKLRKLGIEEVDEYSDISSLFALLSDMWSLDYLTLRGSRFISMPSMDELGILSPLHTLKLDGRLAWLPSVDNLPQNICYLKLVNSCLDEDPMPVLEKLPNLTHLKLRNAFIGQQMVILPDGFPELEVLCIEESWNLRNIQIGKGVMPRLEKLAINNCPYLETLPEEIGSMAFLKEIKMVTTKEIGTKIRKFRLSEKVVEMLEL